MSDTKIQRRAAAYTPFVSTLARELDEARDRMHRLFLDPFGAEPMTTQPIGLFPAVEIAETPQAFTLTAELPGLGAADVTVEFDDGMLVIRGEKEERRDQQEKQLHVTERSYGAFRRAFAFPATVSRDGVTADFNDGVLTVTLPKAAEEPRAKKIEVKARKGG
jgi:HSP20 family protein